jgi:hypothetical protein
VPQTALTCDQDAQSYLRYVIMPQNDLPKSSDFIMPEVIYQTRETLYPRFGLALPEKQQVYLREDLPGCVKRFVISHELYHLIDKAQWWVWREIKATAHASIRHPIGFIACVFMSLAPYRLRYYGQRIRGRVK